MRGSTGTVGDAGNAGVGEGAAQQGADSGGFGGVSVNDLQTACGGHVPEAGVQPSRDGMVSGTWVAACAFRWDVRG